MKLDEVSANITTGEIESSIDVLEKMPVEGMNIVQLSRRHFLLGKAEYVRVIKDIRECREDGSQGASELQEHQVAPLRKALEYFQQSYETAPDSEWAPEAMYAAALTQDYGCLNRFNDAAETYQLLLERYPDSPLVSGAESRSKILKGSLGNRAHGGSHP
jgi:tetratricopeptide (TPR) repeat protein